MTQAAWFYDRGCALIGENKHDEAIAAFSRSLERDPSNAKAYANRGWAKHCLGRFDDAIADHEHALSLDPRDATAAGNCAASLTALGRGEDALARLTAFIEHNGGSSQLYSDRGGIFLQLGRFEAAREDLLAAVTTHPTCGAAHANWANLLATFGELQSALVHAELAEALGLPVAARLARQIRQALAAKG
jgi:Flp pilus assembly protein TadD